jgi:hypothetical protein
MLAIHDIHWSDRHCSRAYCSVFDLLSAAQRVRGAIWALLSHVPITLRGSYRRGLCRAAAKSGPGSGRLQRFPSLSGDAVLPRGSMCFSCRSNTYYMMMI